MEEDEEEREPDKEQEQERGTKKIPQTEAHNRKPCDKSQLTVNDKLLLIPQALEIPARHVRQRTHGLLDRRAVVVVRRRDRAVVDVPHGRG
jgi:hypothetical protein